MNPAEYGKIHRFSNYFRLFYPYGKDHWDFIFACATLIPNVHLQHLLLEVVVHEHSYLLTILIVISQVSKVTQNIAIVVNIPDAVAEVAFLFQTRAWPHWRPDQKVIYVSIQIQTYSFGFAIAASFDSKAALDTLSAVLLFLLLI